MFIVEIQKFTSAKGHPMTYIKLLTVLAGLALLTACGGGTAETPDTAGGNATDCKTNAFHADCNADAPAIELRQSMCLADDSADSTCGVVITGACEANPFRTETACGHTDYDDDRETACLADTTKHSTCVGDTGLATVFCEADPFNTATACVHDDYDDERQTACLADIMEDDSCRGDMGIATLFCEANPFDTATPCMHGDYADERQTMCLANIAIDDSCRGTTGIATLFCEANPFDTATPCGHGDYADERQTMCLANIMIDDSCRGDMGIATVFCKANLFDTSNACMADTYLPSRIADCITAGNAGESKCNTISTNTAMNTAITACLTNPFAPACEAGGSAFATYAETAQTNRLMFCMSNSGSLCTALTTCRATPFGTGCGDYFAPEKIGECIMAGNADNSDCTATISTDTTMNNDIKACLINPFTDTCAMNNDFTTYADMARTNRLTFCKTSTGDTLCTTTNLANVCVFDPFHPICFADGTYDTPRATTISTCSARAKANDPACASALTNPNAATWLQSFTTELSTTPNASRHGFLQGGTATVDFGSIRVSGGADPTVVSLNLGTLGGDAEDGVAFFSGGTVTATNYAGIFSGTNLGAPLVKPATETGAMVEWKGKFGSVGGASIPSKDFTLNVDLYNETIDAFVEHAGGLFFKLEGGFNAKGVIINGKVTYGTFTNGTVDENQFKSPGILTGLIGREGAVGVFHSNNDGVGNTPYIGGFVAVPPVVNTGDLPTYPTKPNAETSTRFLTATETGLNITDIQFQDSATRTILTPHFIGRRGLDSNNPDGFAYFVTTSTLLNPIGYVGILPTTNLGAPLIAQPANAVWAGHFSVAGANNTATNYFVDFTNGKFGFSNAAEDDTDGTLTVSTATYTMNAHFGSHASANGYSAGRMGGTISILDAGTTGSTTIVGLIGAEGAVGIFTQEGAATGYTGGFTATNPN